jgi:hypothetical protein
VCTGVFISPRLLKKNQKPDNLEEHYKGKLLNEVKCKMALLKRVIHHVKTQKMTSKVDIKPVGQIFRIVHKMLVMKV